MLFFLPSSRIFWVNNFDIRNTILSIVWRGREGGEKKSSLQRLVYVLVIYSLSAVYIQGNTLTFQKLPCHFRNNWPVPCAEPTPRPVEFFLFLSLFSFPHATELPKHSLFLSLSLSLFLLTMCQHVDVSGNNNNTRLCEWLRSHFGQVPYKMHYSEIQLDTEFSVVQCSLLCRACGSLRWNCFNQM